MKLISSDYLITASQDKTIKLWYFDWYNPTDARCICTLEGHKHYVTTVFEGPGNCVVSASFDGTINGVTFSGDVQWGDPESYGGVGTFNGSFFGPNASDMGGIFFVHKDNDLEGIDNKDYWTLSGSFTGCKTC